MAAQRDQIAADIATIEQSVGSKQELTGQVARLQAEAKEVEGRLANLTAQRDALTAEIAQSENRVSELQKAADLAGQNLAAIGNEVAQRTQALNTLRQQQQEATRQAEAAKAVFLDAERQLTMLRDQMVNQAEVLRAAAKPGGAADSGCSGRCGQPMSKRGQAGCQVNGFLSESGLLGRSPRIQSALRRKIDAGAVTDPLFLGHNRAGVNQGLPEEWA